MSRIQQPEQRSGYAVHRPVLVTVDPAGASYVVMVIPDVFEEQSSGDMRAAMNAAWPLGVRGNIVAIDDAWLLFFRVAVDGSTAADNTVAGTLGARLVAAISGAERVKAAAEFYYQALVQALDKAFGIPNAFAAALDALEDD